jgi:hypothetical protein
MSRQVFGQGTLRQHSLFRLSLPAGDSLSKLLDVVFAIDLMQSFGEDQQLQIVVQ